MSWKAVGHVHGPGNVSALPHAIQVAGSWVSPPSDPNAAQCSGPAASIKPHKIDLMADEDCGMDEDTIKFFVTGMLSGNAKLQRYIVDNYTLPNVEFVHIQGCTRGRENYFNTYRGATGLMEYKHVAIRDVVVTGTKACVWLDLKIKPRSLLPSIRRNIPCLVWFVFATDPEDGRAKVALQHDHHSFYVITWMGGVVAAWVHEAVLRPLMGWAIVWRGVYYDWLQRAMLGSYGLLAGSFVVGGADPLLDSLYPEGAQQRAIQDSPRSIDRAIRAQTLRLGSQGVLADPSGVAGLRPLQGWGCVASYTADVANGLLGAPSFLFMMVIGVVFSFFGPFPHIFLP